VVECHFIAVDLFCLVEIEAAGEVLQVDHFRHAGAGEAKDVEGAVHAGGGAGGEWEDLKGDVR